MEKSLGEELDHAAAEASRGKDWELCWQCSWECDISSQRRLEIHDFELNEERGRNEARGWVLAGIKLHERSLFDRREGAGVGRLDVF